MSAAVNWMSIAVLPAIVGCGDEPVFRCERDEQCTLDDVAGQCERSGYCTFADPSCDGRRYADSAGDGLAGVCLHVSVFGETGDADYPGVTTDAELQSAAPTANFGSSDNLSLHGLTLTAVVRFELQQLPSTAVIEAAELRAHVLETGELSVELYPLTEAWDEATASWTDRLPGTPWSTAGAGSASRSSAIMGMFGADQLGAVTATLDPAAVQAWVDTPSSNFGMVLMTRAASGATLASSQEGMSSLRPHLVITWR